MIKRLKWKFVAIAMALVLAVLLAVFGVLMLSTGATLKLRSMTALKYALEGNASFFQKPGADNASLPTFTVTVDGADTIYVTNNRYFHLDNDTLIAICGECLSRGEDTGVLSAYSLRYLRVREGDGTRIAFADMTNDKSVLSGLLRASACVGGGALAVLFGVCVLLSSAAVRPAQQAWDKQRAFVADASHELNTPLTVILSNIGLLAQQAQGTNEEARIERVKYEAERMKALTGDLLSLARLDDPGRTRVCAAVDFSELAYQSVLLFEPVFFDEGLTVRSSIEKGLTVSGDAAQLKQLLEILLDNARKYADKRLPVDVGLAAAGKKKVALTVRNFGEVLPREKLAHLFDRFYRTDEARTQGGCGLGLAIAKGIAEAHGGTIGARSDAQDGTVFTVTLPAV